MIYDTADTAWLDMISHIMNMYIARYTHHIGAEVGCANVKSSIIVVTVYKLLALTLSLSS